MRKLSQGTRQRLAAAVAKDPGILVSKEDVETKLGEDRNWLYELGLTNSDLIRMERLGLAIRARYATPNKRAKSYPQDKQHLVPTGPHRIRYLLLKEALA